MRVAWKGSPTKTRLLDAAERLMLAKGFTATTVDEICETAKLTKGSFFHYFESKDALGEELLEHFCAAAQRRHEMFCGNVTDPLKRVYTYIDNAVKMAKDPTENQGCLLGLFAQELCDTNPQIRKRCEQGFEDWTKGFGAELARAKAKYATTTSFDPHELAEHLIAIMEGAMIIGKARNDMSVVATHLKHFKAYVRSLFGARKK